MIPYSPGCNIIFSPVFGRICPAGFGVHTRGIYGMTHASIVGFVGGGQMGRVIQFSGGVIDSRLHQSDKAF